MVKFENINTIEVGYKDNVFCRVVRVGFIDGASRSFNVIAFEYPRDKLQLISKNQASEEYNEIFILKSVDSQDYKLVVDLDSDRSKMVVEIDTSQDVVYNGEYFALFRDCTMGFSDGVGHLGSMERKEVIDLCDTIIANLSESERMIIFNKYCKNRCKDE